MASEMTNEELANELLETVGLDGPFCICERCSIVREATARLRLKQQSDNYAAAMCRQETEYKREICDLRAKLKVAEDALVSYRDFMRTIENDKSIAIENRQENCFWADRLDSVIAAIRNEGGEKASGESEAAR